MKRSTHRFDAAAAASVGEITYAPLSDTGNRPPQVLFFFDDGAPGALGFPENGVSVMFARPPGVDIRAEVESMTSSRVSIRDSRPGHGRAHVADVTVWASGPDPLTEETVAIASALYWSWWRALDMRGDAP